jgi:hypothetical protein
MLSTLTVSTIMDNGSDTAPTAGSLRAAILAADAQPAGTLTTIDFKIGTGRQTIHPPDPLPQITRPVVIDGTTQPGYTGVPIIEIDGTAAGSSTTGFVIASTASGTAAAHATITGLEITDFGGGGVSVQANEFDLNTDYIGVGFLETSINAFGNGLFGIEFSNGASDDRIIATTVAATTGNGVVITGSGTSNDALTGDFIGTDPTGNMPFLLDGSAANTGSGVVISGGANHITISTSVISNNDEEGVSISGADTEFNALTGDWIGTNPVGSYELRNGDDGVLVTSSASFNTIGGTGIAARDIISGNGADGVSFSGDSDNEVLGDYIGLDPTGTVRVTNGIDGVLFSGSSNDTVGGTAAGAGDVISGSGYNGVAITSESTGILVAGDLIGTDASGGQRIVNNVGVLIDGSAKSNTIGGTTAGARDVISANQSLGVLISDSGTSRNIIEGDYIGTNAAGTSAIVNYTNGVEIAAGATANTIGGTTAGARDVISGNQYNGVVIDSSGTTFNVVEGDYIGTDATGTQALANGADGVNIYGGATANTVGGTTAGARDVISGNTSAGVYLSDASTSANVVEGDYIGTDTTGAKALANGLDGVQILGGATSNTLGGTTAGARDVISGNASVGVYIMGSSTSDNVVEGDYIGTSAVGTAAVPNAINGLDIVSGATLNTVGGTTAGARDVISGNTFNGVVLAFSGTSYNQVLGDYIGTDDTGGKALANGQDGVDLIGGATANIVGGLATNDRNIISGNADNGVLITDPGTAYNDVQGDFIGTDSTGAFAVPNTTGVVIQNAASSNTVGGLAEDRNIISGNVQSGVVVTDIGTIGNTVRYNSIGTDSTGEHPVPNRVDGIIVQNGAADSYVYNNLISANGNDGVLVLGSSTNTNYIEFNSIGLDSTGLKALKQTGQSYSNLTGVAIDGATNTLVESNIISGNSTGIYVGAGATSNWISYDDVGTGIDGLTSVGNLQDGVVLDGVSGNVIDYDVLVYNGNVGILFEHGATEAGNLLAYGTFTLTVNGVTYGNKNGAIELS